MIRQFLPLASLCLILSSWSSTDSQQSQRTVTTSTQQHLSRVLPQEDRDNFINSQVIKALREDPKFGYNQSRMTVETINGVVTIRGEIADEFQKRAIGEKAKGVQGVVNVDNQLQIHRSDVKP